MRRLAGSGLLVLAALLAAVEVPAATISVVNKNNPGEGFNDATPATPVGGNPGTTVGDQRLNVFREAARIWGQLLPAGVEIKVDARFIPLDCSETTAVLGAAGALSVQSDFQNAEFPGTWYPAALANQLAGQDLDAGTSEIQAKFNSNLGQTGCFTGSGFYYGFDGNPGSRIDLLVVVLHELGHGLGFQSFVDTAGTYLGPPAQPDVFTRFIYDDAAKKGWIEMASDSDRLASTTNPENVAFTGGNSTAFGGSFLGRMPRLLVTSPAAAAGAYAVGLATFGPALGAAGISGTLVAASPSDPGGSTSSDGCTALANPSAVAGRIALINRGTCNFTVKVKNAQNAGAIAVVIADYDPAIPPNGMSGTDATIVIPAVRVSQADGTKLRSNLPASVSLGLDATRLAGADASGRLLLYTPSEYDPGSSVSHFSTSASPDLLMEPYVASTHPVNVDATLPALKDLGWFGPNGGGTGGSSGALLLPSVTHSPGNNRALYTSDVFVSNRGTTDATFTMKFLGHDADGTSGAERTFSLPAGQSRVFRDVLGSAFGESQNYGSLRFVSNVGTLAVSSVTSTPPPAGAGAFGQSVPAMTSSQLIAAGRPATITGIREEEGKYRTNLALANATSAALQVDVALVADDGASLGAKSVVLPPLGMTQLGRIAEQITGTRSVANATLVLSTPTPGGSFAAFASLIEFYTNDPATLLPATTGASGTTFMPSTARSKGSGNSYYTSDLFVSNRGTTPAVYTLKFLNHLVDGTGGAERTFSLLAGQTRVFRDVLGSVFGLSSNADYGAIRVTADSTSLVVSSVTSTPPAAGPGAFGQSVPGSATPSLIGASSPATIVGVREDGSYRTNLVLANATEASLDVDIVLFADDGSTLGTLRQTLLPLEMIQLNRIAATITGGSGVTDSTLVLSTPTPGGAFAAFASLIEFNTNDPATLFPQ